MARKPKLAIVTETQAESSAPRYTLLSGHAASAYQAAVFDAIADVRSGSRIVKAVAGAGKTTVVKNALRYLPPGSHVQGFAFNKDAAQNLKDGLAEVVQQDDPEKYKNVRMGTFHSVGFGAICRYLNKRAGEIKPEPKKIRNIIDARLREEDREIYGGFVAQLVGYARGEGIGAIVPDVEDRWYTLIEHHGLTLEAEEADEGRAVDIARKVLAYSNRLAKERSLVDFDDMLYLPLLWKLRLWQNDLVFVDEAQDTSPTRRAFARLALKRDGRLFAVGDPKQSIYGFAGASVDAMETIAHDFGAAELPLTVSYRCAQAVVTHAKQWVPYLEASETAIEGDVRHDVPVIEAMKELTDEDAVLCRQSAPLIDFAYQAIAAGRGVRMLGRDIGEGLLSLIRAQRAKGIDRLIEKIEAWREREVARWVAKGEDYKADAVADRAQCVLTLIAHLPETERTIPALERAVRKIFRTEEENETSSNQQKLLTLATVHRSKGMEYPTVAILRPDLMPGRTRVDWQYEQEVNLQYVAATRARERLWYLT